MSEEIRWEPPPFAGMTEDSLMGRIVQLDDTTPTGEGMWIDEDFFYACIFTLRFTEQTLPTGEHFFTWNKRNYYCA